MNPAQMVAVVQAAPVVFDVARTLQKVSETSRSPVAFDSMVTSAVPGSDPCTEH